LGNRKYVKCLYVYNKIDTITIEEINGLARMPNSTVMSVNDELNIDVLIDHIWEYLGLTRIYTKRRGQPPDLIEPTVLSAIRKGTTVKSLCSNISSVMLRDFSFAMVWGLSAKHEPQRCGLTHELCDEDVVQVVLMSAKEQRNDKNYQRQVQAFDDAYKKKKKIARELKQKKVGRLVR